MQAAVYGHVLLTLWAFSKDYLPSETHTWFSMIIEFDDDLTDEQEALLADNIVFGGENVTSLGDFNATEFGSSSAFPGGMLNESRRMLRGGGGGGKAGGRGEASTVNTDTLDGLFKAAMTRECAFVPSLVFMLIVAIPVAESTIPVAIGVVRQFVIEPLLLTCHQLSVCVKWTKRQIKKCITGKNQFKAREKEEVCTHPKAGKKWSVDIIGVVDDALSSFDLTKHESYGGAFGPGMEKQTITTKGLVQLSEVDLEAQNRKFLRRQKARKAIRWEQAEDAMDKTKKEGAEGAGDAGGPGHGAEALTAGGDERRARHDRWAERGSNAGDDRGDLQARWRDCS